MKRTHAFSFAAATTISLVWALTPGCGSDPGPNASGGGGAASSSNGGGVCAEECVKDGATCVYGDTGCIYVFICKQGMWEQQPCTTSSTGMGGGGGIGGAGGNGGMGGSGGTGGSSGGGGT